MVLRFVVNVHTTCFGLHGHLQVCKIFYFLVLKESASLLFCCLCCMLYYAVSNLCLFFVAFSLIFIFMCACKTIYKKAARRRQLNLKSQETLSLTWTQIAMPWCAARLNPRPSLLQSGAFSKNGGYVGGWAEARVQSIWAISRLSPLSTAALSTPLVAWPINRVNTEWATLQDTGFERSRRHISRVRLSRYRQEHSCRRES
jgi:hypothetical protein